MKVFNLLKSIEQKVKEGVGTSPYLLSIGERAAAIAEAFKQRQLSTQEALQQLEDPVRDWLLKQQGAPVAEAEAVAADMATVWGQYPHWRASDQQARKVRQALYSRLEKAGVRDVPDVAEHIMAIVRRERA